MCIFVYTCISDVPEIVRGLVTSGYAHCSIAQTWADILDSPDLKKRYRSGGLGKWMVPDEYEVWLCDGYDLCHGGLSGKDMMCYAFNEKLRSFLPLGPNSKLKFVKSIIHPDILERDKSKTAETLIIGVG